VSGDVSESAREPSQNEVAQKPAPAPSRRRPWRALALTFAVGALVLLVVLWSIRSALVTALVTRALASRGVTCAHLDISASALLDELTVSPAVCTVENAEIVEVRWDAPMTVTMSGGAVGAMSADVVRIVRRRHPADDLPLGDLLRAPERVGGVLLFASRLAQLDSPRLTASRVEIVRDGDGAADLTLSELVIPERDASEPVEATVSEILLATVAGPMGMAASPRLATVVLHAERDRGTLAGTPDPTVELPMMGALRLGGLLGEQRIEVSVEGLDGPEPRFSVRAQN